MINISSDAYDLRYVKKNIHLLSVVLIYGPQSYGPSKLLLRHSAKSICKQLRHLLFTFLFYSATHIIEYFPTPVHIHD